MNKGKDGVCYKEEAGRFFLSFKLVLGDSNNREVRISSDLGTFIK